MVRKTLRGIGIVIIFRVQSRAHLGLARCTLIDLLVAVTLAISTIGNGTAGAVGSIEATIVTLPARSCGIHWLAKESDYRIKCDPEIHYSHPFVIKLSS